MNITREGRKEKRKLMKMEGWRDGWMITPLRRW